MANIIKSLFTTASFTMVFMSNIYAQSRPNEISDAAAIVLATSKKAYAENIGYQSRLFNGIKFTDYPVANYIGNAYWVTNEFQNANLHYNDADFYNIPILYDIHREIIVIIEPIDTSKIILINNKLDRFSIGSHEFIRINNDNSASSIPAGFYELLYNGKTRFVKKHTKDIVEENNGFRIDYVFKEHDTYYILKNNIYNPVSGGKAILNLLKDRKKELGQFIKTNGIDFKGENEERDMVKVITYYDQLDK